MNISRDLLKAASESILPFGEARREKALVQLDELITTYTVACQLSNGKIPDRCRDWEMNAIQARKALEKFICGNGGEAAKPRKKV